MVIVKVLLFPFAVIYDLITRFRNHLYTIGHKKSFRFQTMLIAVGNLNVGGSGKTPMIEYLTRLLSGNHSLATLSRGYGRRTKGIRFASDQDDARTLGDEPFQFFRKFGKKVKVVVSEDRVMAVPLILHEFPETDIILLDDAYQHRAIVPQLSILLTEYAKPFYNDFVLPAGYLRESRTGAARADMIVVTKCPAALSDSTTREIINSIEKYAGKKPVFFTTVHYENPQPFQEGTVFKPEVILVSGIANPQPFEEYAKLNFKVVRHFKFADHHFFSTANLTSIRECYDKHEGKPVILTTEKDWARLAGNADRRILDLPWFYLPIRIAFLKNGPDFDKLVTHSLESSKVLI